ncbi:MAG TPA: hypothetical protein VN646_11290 [Candidatus Acidoferrum sp.]|nr:hypothetical protein [Candidatus Acidoferrum sp.]
MIRSAGSPYCGWISAGLIAVGVERQGDRLSLSHIADWRTVFFTM